MRFTSLLIILSMMNVVPRTEATEKTVKLATLAWEPYVAPGLKNNGYAAEIVIEVIKRSGYTAVNPLLSVGETVVLLV